MKPLPTLMFSAIAGLFYSREILDAIREAIAPKESLRLLDAPCGTGTLHAICAPCAYHGADMDPQRVEDARRLYPDSTFVCSDSCSLPFEDRSFDRILAAGLFHHVDDETADHILQEYARLLKPDGRLIVFEAIWPKHCYNVWGAFMRWMDQGDFVRHISAYDALFSEHFDIATRSYPYRLGLDYYLATLSKGTS